MGKFKTKQFDLKSAHVFKDKVKKKGQEFKSKQNIINKQKLKDSYKHINGVNDLVTVTSNKPKIKDVNLGLSKQVDNKTKDAQIVQGQVLKNFEEQGTVDNHIKTCKDVVCGNAVGEVHNSPESVSQKAENAPNPSKIISNTEKPNKKRKKASKKDQNGSSNWMKLCKELNIDASKRKKSPIKKQVEEETTKESDTKKVKTDVWFDNVDSILVEGEESIESGKEGDESKLQDSNDKLVKPDSFKGLTSCVAMDCEMVGVGPRGEDSILARVSIVNHFGVCLYDTFVLPREKVTDYRTFVSGVTPENLATGEEFTIVQKKVSDIIKGRILVGHALRHDLQVLFLTHPHKMIRDTSKYKPFRDLFKGKIPSLKKLTEKLLNVTIQEGEHSSIQDAQATMRLYTMHRQKWEKELKMNKKVKKKEDKKSNLKQ
ncbi:uncharacterized protein LOC131952887 isoform X2 [Physella acuta]|nr:uncharacterized protein LOC131952887 isoform X2 [Physella acuta]XP_059171799.1 uncharacterized protein LOC131952887 isoform X2 [Physella acuta]XP_059171800.1 uncharacterized protein LOC131952887 isoform X2 [Physella acuta]